MASEDTADDSTASTPSVVTAVGEFFWRNRRYIARDLLVSLGWVLVLTAVFVLAPLPGWLYYILLFGGLLVYSLVVSLAGMAAKLDQ